MSVPSVLRMLGNALPARQLTELTRAVVMAYAGHAGPIRNPGRVRASCRVHGTTPSTRDLIGAVRRIGYLLFGLLEGVGGRDLAFRP